MLICVYAPGTQFVPVIILRLDMLKLYVVIKLFELFGNCNSVTELQNVRYELSI